MKLERWVQVSELVSGLAVLVTLVFLVIGVRDNTNVTQAGAYQDLLAELNQFNFVLMRDSDLATLWLHRLDHRLHEMDPADANRLVFMNRAAYRVLDAAYFSFRNGSLGPEQWDRFRQSICNLHRTESPNFSELWSETKVLVSPEFVSYLEGACSR
jgi:hypothetical protein